MSEASRRQAIREALSQRGYLVVAFPAGPFGRKGTSDLLVCALGRFIAIECKDADGKPTPEQLSFGKLVERAGGVFLIARTPAEAIQGVERGLATPPRREFFT